MSTCGVLHSIGSDLTRTRGRSEIQQNGSIRSEQTTSKARDLGNTPTSRAEVGVVKFPMISSGNSFDLKIFSLLIDNLLLELYSR